KGASEMSRSPLSRRLAMGAAALLAGGAIGAGTRGPAASAAVAHPASAGHPLLRTSNGRPTSPGPAHPLGKGHPSPHTTTRPDGGGYAYGDSTITSFPLTHMDGPGCNGGASDVPIMPSTGAVVGTATSSFSHANESANAGYYKVTMGNGVTVELTATTRSGMARFTYPATTQANLLFKLSTGDNTGATSFSV